MRKILALALLSMVTAAAAPGAMPAQAQQVQRIAAVVNDDVVSVFDLRARMQVVISSSGLEPTPQLQRRLAQQVLRRLIDERLQMQEARRRNVTVTQANMDDAVAQIEKQNRIPPGEFDAFMKRAGIPKEAVLEQLRAQVAWAKLVGRVLRPRVTVGEDEIEEEIRRLKSRSGQTEYRVSEILLTVDGPDREREVRRTAERLVEELRKGAKFDAVARQFSRGASASVGGDLGWLSEASLGAELRRVVTRLRPGEVVGPVETPAGIHIFRLAEKRRVMAPSDDETTVALHQILLPVPEGAGEAAVGAQMDLARILGETVSGCEDMARAAEEARSGAPADLGRMKLGALARPVRDAVEGLPVGTVSTPVRTDDGVALYMVCARTEPETNLPSREEIAERLRMEKLQILARRFMRDLRNAAVVDLRV